MMTNEVETFEEPFSVTHYLLTLAALNNCFGFFFQGFFFLVDQGEVCMLKRTKKIFFLVRHFANLFCVKRGHVGIRPLFKEASCSSAIFWSENIFAQSSPSSSEIFSPQPTPALNILSQFIMGSCIVNGFLLLGVGQGCFSHVLNFHCLCFH